MKYAICILVHKNPALLERIVDRISGDNTEIYVHLDAKCNIKDYLHIKDVTFIEKRVSVNWGGRSMIIAMYNLIEYVVNKTTNEFLIFISGQDFPMVEPDLYDHYIDISKNYLEYERIPKKDWYLGGIERIKYYYIFNSSESIQSRIFIKFQKIMNINRRCWKKGFSVFGGSQWININRIAAKYILSNWKYYYKYFKYCNVPDELIFQTILLNSPLKETVVNTNYRFLKYKENSPNPIYLDESHSKDIVKSNVLLCRKIYDENAFDRLNHSIKTQK